MSGHSKWATIKRQKVALDIKRGQTFTKLANAITISVRNGGGITDPENNFKLRLAIEKAHQANMPKDNIERAIARAVGGDAGKLEEVVYEGFAPGGVSVIVEAATDNSQRTTSEIKNIFSKEGASFGQPGAVSYQFINKGRIVVKKNGKKLNEIFDLAAESGAEDLEEVEGEVFIFTPANEIAKVRDELSRKGLNIVNVELIKKAVSPVLISDKVLLEKVVNFLHKLEELDDVQKVYSNLE